MPDHLIIDHTVKCIVAPYIPGQQTLARKFNLLFFMLHLQDNWRRPAAERLGGSFKSVATNSTNEPYSCTNWKWGENLYNAKRRWLLRKCNLKHIKRTKKPLICLKAFAYRHWLAILSLAQQLSVWSTTQCALKNAIFSMIFSKKWSILNQNR